MGGKICNIMQTYNFKIVLVVNMHFSVMLCLVSIVVQIGSGGQLFVWPLNKRDKILNWPPTTFNTLNNLILKNPA